jgi:ATP-dependent Clp protease adaptor protein ClpS
MLAYIQQKITKRAIIMANENQNEDAGKKQNSDPFSDSNGNTAVKTKSKTAPVRNDPRQLPPWKVLLHNDDVNDMEYVRDTITLLTSLNKQDADLRMEEAHKTGVSLLLVTHQERAELYLDQFTSRKLTVSIEPAE